MHQRFLEALVRDMGCDPSVLAQSGVTVKASPRRADNHVTAGYVVGEHFIVTCDPAVEQQLTEAVAAASMQPTLEAWAALAQDQGGEFLGGGRMQLHPAAELPAAVPLADGYELRTLDRRLPADRALIEELVSVSSEADLDEAEIELDNLDDIIEVVVDSSGAIASFGSSRDFDLTPGFGDIGIMTRPEHRGRGLGSAAVIAVSHRIREAGDEALYRCDEANTGSIALSKRLGFTVATQLTAYRFPSETTATG